MSAEARHTLGWGCAQISLALPLYPQSCSTQGNGGSNSSFTVNCTTRHQWTWDEDMALLYVLVQCIQRSLTYPQHLTLK